MVSSVGGAWLVVACSSSAPVGPTAPRAVVVIESTECAILQAPRFEQESEHLAEDDAVVVATASTLKRSLGNVVLMELAGHAADNEREPVALSLRRANALRDALVAHGVDAARIVTRGYGAYCPNDVGAEQDRSRNRRVELRVLRTKEGDTGVEHGCAAARAAGVDSH